MLFLIEVIGGKKVLVDVGLLQPARDRLLPFLQTKKITSIDMVVISHPHRDHYEGLMALVEGGIQLKQVLFNVPDRGVCDREKPWGCDYQQVLEYRKFLLDNGVIVGTAEVGQEWNLGEDVYLNVLYAYDGVDTPVGTTDINDMSLIMMLTAKNHKILLTGDLNRSIGEYLASNGTGLKADILKMPHHGTEGTAPNEFFEKVSPSLALVPSPSHLWCSSRSERIRNWLQMNGVKTFVNGKQGHVSIQFYDNTFRVSSEFDSSSSCQK